MFTWCNERKGHTRCEGCQQLYCLPCIHNHHEELIMQFQLLIGVQKELKESFNMIESSWQTKKEHPCLSSIDQWEQEVITRIQQIATKARTTTIEMMTKNMSDIRQRLNQLAFDMEQRQQEGNYLDNDTAELKNQIEQLNSAIKHVNGKIRIDYSATNKVDWGSLIYVTTEKKFADQRLSVSELSYVQENSQDNIWNNVRNYIKNKYLNNNDYKSKQASFKRTTPSLFEPIALTSYGSSTCSTTQQNSAPKIESTISDKCQANDPFSNTDPFNFVTFTTFDHNQCLSQASEA